MLWWLSFADPHGKNLGVCVVDAEDIEQAAQVAWQYGCNPGGEVFGLPVPPDDDIYEACLRNSYKLVVGREAIQETFGPVGSTKDDTPEAQAIAAQIDEVRQAHEKEDDR